MPLVESTAQPQVPAREQRPISTLPVQAPQDDPRGGWERRRSRLGSLRKHPVGRLGVAITVVTAASLLAAALMIRFGSTPMRELGWDTAKFTAQLLLVGLAGGVLLQEYSRDRAKRMAANEFRKLVMRSLLRAYSDTKRVRRMLRARCVATSGGAEVGMPSASYDESMRQINDTQIELEVLLRELKVFKDAFDRAGALTRHLTGMEKYLGRLVDEYETRRRDFVGSDCRALSELPVLQAFLVKRPAGDFRTGFAHHFHAALTLFQEERLRL